MGGTIAETGIVRQKKNQLDKNSYYGTATKKH